MTRLLRIDASPRTVRSRSRAIADHLVGALTASSPDLEVETLDLFAADLPAFDQAAIEGRYELLFGQPVQPEQAAAWQRLDEMARHFLGFDAWLFAVPMWNFGLPYRMKQYIDLITHPGLAFRNDAEGNVEGLATGRSAIIVAASAMPFGTVPEIEPLDFQLTYLKAWLGFIGVTAVHAVRVAGTFGPDDQVAAAMERARIEADALAHQLAPLAPRV